MHDPLGFRMSRMVPILALLLILVIPAPLRAAEDRVATIMIYGLRNIERGRLLEDLSLAEGDAYDDDLIGKLRYRAKHLAYLKVFHATVENGIQGAHLTLSVREASRLRFAPFFSVQDDGDLGGGFLIESDALLRKNELWRGRIVGGGRTEASLDLTELRGGAAWLPAFNMSIGIMDWDHPFWQSDVRRRWFLAGPSFRLPGEGHLLLLFGYEFTESEPPVGIDPLGDDDHGLLRARWRQPLFASDTRIELETELRTRQEQHSFGRGVLSLHSARRQGRWHFTGQAASGMASDRSPASAIDYMDSWRYLRAYDPSTLPARRFHFFRLRGDLRLTRMGIRLKRGGPEEHMIYSFYLMAEGALSKARAEDPFTSSSDYGFGIGIQLPSRTPTRASVGIQWNDDGESVGIFLLENN